MGIFDFFKNSKEGNKKSKDVMPSKQNDTEKGTKKTTFLVRYKIGFKAGGPDDLNSFDQLPCNNTSKKDVGIQNCFLCKKLMESNKYYSRADIESISAKLGHSVFDNIGGAIDDKGYPICSCEWKSVTITEGT
jgi:hypothetical protein